MITLQPRRNGPPRPELLEVLESCHERIRRFSGLAGQLARATRETPDSEIADAARSIRDYFAIAFPLHGLDEDLSLIPRLRGADPALDAALDRIEPDHRVLDASVERLVAICGELAAAPATLDAHRESLASVARDLAARLADHLAHEEATLLPAVETRLAPHHSEILAEIRARRAPRE